MPIYEFECLDCGTTTEILVAPSEMDLVVCSQCGSRHLKKLMSAHAQMNPTGNYPDSPADRCCGVNGPPSGSCAGPGSCCGRGAMQARDGE